MRTESLPREVLSEIPMLAGVDPTVPATVWARNAIVHLERGEVLFSQGDRCQGFYFVARGRMRLTVTNRQGATTTMEIISEGETFGEAVVFLDRPYPVTATALLPSTLYLVSTAFVDEVLDRDPRAARVALANLSMRNHQLVSHVAALALETATQRVCTYLLEQEGVRRADGTVELLLEDPKNVIANRLNLTPESMSRALRRLEDDAVIAMDGPRVRFSAASLRAHAEGALT